MGAIRNIAADVNFTLDPKWNTQSSGRKLIDFLNNSSASETTPASEFAPKSDAGPVPESKPTTTPASSTTQKPTSSPASKPVAKPAQPKNDNELTEEEMNELLKQIAELRKTIEALEARIAKLEKSSIGAPTIQKKPVGLTYEQFQYPDYGYLGSPIINITVFRLSDGRQGKPRRITSNDGNYTVGQTRKIADMFGHIYDSKTKREDLGWELVSKYGDGKYAFIANKAVDSNGKTYDFIELKGNSLYDPDALAYAMNKKELWHSKQKFTDVYQNEPFNLDLSWTDEEIRENLVKFIDKLVRKD